MAKVPPGKKSKPWDEDPEILKRLATVEDLVLAGYRNTEIASQLKVVEATIRNDRNRIAELWRRESGAAIVEMRSRSIANLRRIQRLADNEFRNQRERPLNLRLQLDAEKEIVRLQGTTTPVDVPITFTNQPDAATLSTNDLLERAAALEAMAQQLLAEEAGTDALPPV